MSEMLTTFSKLIIVTVTALYYMFNVFFAIVGSTAKCNYYTDAANVTDVRRLDVFDTVPECEYDVRWTQRYTPWWRLRAEVTGEATDTLRLPCVPFDVRRVEGCYPNILAHPRFHYVSRETPADIVDIAFVRIAWYLAVIPAALALVYWVYRGSGSLVRRCHAYRREGCYLPLEREQEQEFNVNPTCCPKPNTTP